MAADDSKQTNTSPSPEEGTQRSVEEAKQRAQDAAEGAKQEAKTVRDQVVDEAKSLRDRAQETIRASADQQKERAADELGGVAEVIRKTGEELRGQDHPGVAQYAERLAERVEGASQYLRERDLGSFVRELENFARREPAIFVGSAVALGLIAARFLKSSAERGRESYSAGAGESAYSYDET